VWTPTSAARSDRQNSLAGALLRVDWSMRFGRRRNLLIDPQTRPRGDWPPSEELQPRRRRALGRSTVTLGTTGPLESLTRLPATRSPAGHGPRTESRAWGPKPRAFSEHALVRRRGHREVCDASCAGIPYTEEWGKSGQVCHQTTPSAQLSWSRTNNPFRLAADVIATRAPSRATSWNEVVPPTGVRAPEAFHGLRHTFDPDGLRRVAPTHSLRKIARPRQPATTQRYLHPTRLSPQPTPRRTAFLLSAGTVLWSQMGPPTFRLMSDLRHRWG